MNLIYKIVLTLFFLYFSALGWADEKPSLTVRFEVKKNRYRDDFPTEINQIEKKCAQKIIEALNGYFGFMRFTEDQASNTLSIVLDDNEPASYSSMREVGFKITLTNSHSPSTTKEVYWKFRDKEEYDRTLGTRAAFIKEVSDVFKRRLNVQQDLLVTCLLSKIAITDKAKPIREELIWVLPFKKTDLGIDNESKLIIKVEFYRKILGKIERPYYLKTIGEYDPENIKVSLPYYLGIIAEALKEQKHLDEINTNLKMDTKGIFIIEYIPYNDPLKPISSEKKEERR